MRNYIAQLKRGGYRAQAPKGFAAIPARDSDSIRSSSTKTSSRSSRFKDAKISRSASNHELKSALSHPNQYVDAAIDVMAANNPNELPFRKMDKVDYSIDFKTRNRGGSKQLAPVTHEPYVDPAQLTKQTSWHAQLNMSGSKPSKTSSSTPPTTPSRPSRAVSGARSTAGTPQRQQRVPISRRPRARSFGDPSLSSGRRSRSSSAGESRLPQPTSFDNQFLHISPPRAKQHAASTKPAVKDDKDGPTEAEIDAIRNVLATTIPQHTTMSTHAAPEAVAAAAATQASAAESGTNDHTIIAADKVVGGLRVGATGSAPNTPGRLHKREMAKQEQAGKPRWDKSPASVRKMSSSPAKKYPGGIGGGSPAGGGAAVGAAAGAAVLSSPASSSSARMDEHNDGHLDFKALVGLLEQRMIKGQTMLSTFETMAAEREGLSQQASNIFGSSNLVADAEATLAAGVFPEQKVCQNVFGQSGTLVDLEVLVDSGPQVTN